MDWLERNRSNFAAALVVLIAVAAALLLQVPRRPALEVAAPSIPVAPPPIKVHVIGAVTSPGVYQLIADARVEDALDAAGGASGDADLSTLNLAASLRDGQQLSIPQARSSSQPGDPSLTTASSGTVALAVSSKLNLNSASAKELELLPGIGTVTAQKIVDFREQNGPIGSIDELRDAKVITASMYEKINELVETR